VGGYDASYGRKRHGDKEATSAGITGMGFDLHGIHRGEGMDE
jgi:hypothetical protein